MLHFWRGRFFSVQACSFWKELFPRLEPKALRQRFRTFSSSRTVLCICAVRPTIVCIVPRTLTVLDCASWTRSRRCQHPRCHARRQQTHKDHKCRLLRTVRSMSWNLISLGFKPCISFAYLSCHAVPVPIFAPQATDAKVFGAWPWIQPQ